MKINTEDDGVYEAEITVDQARELAGADGIPDELSTVIDNAQGAVFTGDRETAIVVLTITKG